MDGRVVPHADGTPYILRVKLAQDFGKLNAAYVAGYKQGDTYFEGDSKAWQANVLPKLCKYFSKSAYKHDLPPVEEEKGPFVYFPKNA